MSGVDVARLIHATLVCSCFVEFCLLNMAACMIAILDLNASLHALHIINYLYKMMRLYIYLLKRRINDSEF